MPPEVPPLGPPAPAVLLEVFRAPLHLHGGVARDDPRARARGVEEDAVQLRHHTHELLPVHASGDDIRQPEAVAVRDEGLAPWVRGRKTRSTGRGRSRARAHPWDLDHRPCESARQRKRIVAEFRALPVLKRHSGR